MTVLGVSLSKWDNTGTIAEPKTGNWETAKSKGVQFAFIRAGSVDSVFGTCYTDYCLDAHAIGAKNAEVPFGLYWYFRQRYDPLVQARYFIELLKKYPYKINPVLDVEDGTYTLSSTLFAERIIKFHDEVFQATGRHVIVYTRQSFWDYKVAANPLWKTLGLWAARYTTTLPSPWGDGRYKFRDWTNWTFWQFEADTNLEAEAYGFKDNGAGSSSIEKNWFNGSLSDFRTYIGEVEIPLYIDIYQWVEECLYPWIRSQDYEGPPPPKQEV